MGYSISINRFRIAVLFICSFLMAVSCAQPNAVPPDIKKPAKISSIPVNNKKVENPVKVIHVFVALCDNKYQGIVPVPASLGNGDDPEKNLYWGAAFGVKTFFERSRNWETVRAPKSPEKRILRRVAFRHKRSGAILIADAYRGKEIRPAIEEFLGAVSGEDAEELRIAGNDLQVKGGADVLVYVGHNGLMDFEVERPRYNAEGKRSAIVLACYSKQYFKKLLDRETVDPLVWTTHLMAPEAYILHDALEAYIAGKSNSRVRERAARAYSKYQRIGLGASRKLLVTGW